MIWQATHMYMPETIRLNSLFGAHARIYASAGNVPGNSPNDAKPYDLIRQLMELSQDTVVFVITPDQLNTFLKYMEKYDLEKYLVVDHRGANDGAANRNYAPYNIRLKMFILKGQGEIQ